MTLRRAILLTFLVIPVVMIIISLFESPVDPGLESAFYNIGVPIAVVNMWEWFEPEVMEKLFGKLRVDNEQEHRVYLSYLDE